MKECFLELHPKKTKIVYCKKSGRKEDHENISFDFLGYTFRPRSARTKTGIRFLNFTPAISGKAKKTIMEKIRIWKLPNQTRMSLEEIARWVNPQIRGWINYYGKFYRSALNYLMGYIEYKLCIWASKKYKNLKGHREQARRWLRKIRQGQLRAIFAHWEFVY